MMNNSITLKMSLLITIALLITTQFEAHSTSQPPNVPPLQQLEVVNPSSGAELFVQIYRPRGSTPNDTFPVLILIPGGSSAGSTSFSAPDVQSYADLGFLTVIFDPDGRGRSEGVEDDNGTVHQDGLAEIVRMASQHPQNDGSVVLTSFSYGVTMASGVMARYPELPVVFYVDWEGPANRDDTGGCDGAGLGHLQEHDCDDEAFWSEREAATFISQIDVPYQRVQSERDHVQPDNAHALLMINHATSTEFGGGGISPWTRLNFEAPDQIYDSESSIEWAPEEGPVSSKLMPHLEAFLASEIP